MSTGKIVLGVLVGVGAVAAIPFTGGGSVLGGASLIASLAGAEAIAVGAAVVGGAAGAVMAEKEKGDRKKENENQFREGSKAGENATKQKFSTILKTQKERDLLVLISLKIGVYIAKLDGVIDLKEIDEIHDIFFFINNDPNSPPFFKAKIKKMLDSQFTFEEIIKEVKELLKNKTEREKIEYYKFFDKLISKIIQADGHNHPSEIDFYNKWILQFKVF